MKKLFYSIMIILFAFLTGCNNQDEFIIEDDTSIKELNTDIASSDENALYKEEKDIKCDSQKELYVYVCGQVNNPGMYELSTGDRIYHAIEAAGGLTSEADDKSLNQALIVSDEMQIYVPSLGEDIKEITNEAIDDGKININTASKEELMTLQGIGEAKALAIIDYREANNGFTAIEDIMNIEGVKTGVFNKIESYIKIN